jgi:hypothetical protein
MKMRNGMEIKDHISITMDKEEYEQAAGVELTDRQWQSVVRRIRDPNRSELYSILNHITGVINEMRRK